MSDTFTPLEDVIFRDVKYIKLSDDGPAETHPYEFVLKLPEPLASWDVFDYWEKERTHSMRDNLKQGDVLFDIGAEHGWLSVIYSKFVGAKNMVLMEPTPEFWPNILETWRANGLADPKGCFVGLIGNDIRNIGPNSLSKGWPLASQDNKLIDKLKYVYIHENGQTTPQITIDYYVDQTGIIPDALTMDTEGAEILILKGAQMTLAKHRPLVWASLHPDLALRDYNSNVKDVHALMASFGYEGQYLATDHEEHWLFKPL